MFPGADGASRCGFRLLGRVGPRSRMCRGGFAGQATQIQRSWLSGVVGRPFATPARLRSAAGGPPQPAGPPQDPEHRAVTQDVEAVRGAGTAFLALTARARARGGFESGAAAREPKERWSGSFSSAVRITRFDSVPITGSNSTDAHGAASGWASRTSNALSATKGNWPRIGGGGRRHITKGIRRTHRIA